MLRVAFEHRWHLVEPHTAATDLSRGGLPLLVLVSMATTGRNAPHVTEPPKGRRKKTRFQRRLAYKKPLSARLVLDHRIKGDIGVLSDDLILDLFPHVNISGRYQESFSQSTLCAVFNQY